MRRNIPCPLPQ